MKQLKHSIRGQGKAFKRLIEASFEEWGKSWICKALHNLAFPLLFGLAVSDWIRHFLPRNKHDHDLRRLTNTSCQFRGKQ